ncbi:MAG: DUF1801 domain-containing protein [Candidatus Aenigmarchaeota archaeon]|nr:DUF1801 domain-containing protein [Candidatus Aenigmarchaeota archaeon]
MKSKEVDEYIEKQKSPQKEICRKLRKIILAKFPKAEEKMKLGVPWYGKFYIVSLKDSVNLGFSVEGLPKKDADNFSGKGRMMRHLKFRDVKEIDEKKISGLLELVDKKAKCGSCYK